MPNHARLVLVPLVFVPMLLGFLACGGGGHSPSEPSPSSDALTGTWAGTIVEDSPPGQTCSVTVVIGDPPDLVGNWQARCPDGSTGSNLAFAFELPFSQVVIAAVPHQAIFGACGWSSAGTKDGRRISGDWSTSDNCQTGPALRGRMALTKQN